MGLFRPYQRRDATPDEKSGDASRLSSLTPKAKTSAKAAPAAAAEPAVETPAPAEPRPKGRQVKTTPTPTRRQAEAERMARLHPTLSRKEQKRKDREARYTQRMEAMEKMESSPERVLLRDFLDARWTINEFMLPAMILVMALTMFTINNVLLSSYVAMALWLLLIMAIINTALMWSSFKKVLAQRVPNANKRGLLMYMFNRSIMIRRFRRPAPRIARGDDF